MTDPLSSDGDGHTLLGEDERQGLRLPYVTTRGELNEAEEANIGRAIGRTRPPTTIQLLDDLYLRRLHQRMLGDVWDWAGEYRTRDTNIGIDPRHVSVAMRNLVEDTKTQVAAGDDPDTIATRFHHRLVQIHPFPNGNGRHSRIATNYLLRALGRPAFTWGAAQAIDQNVRTQYLEALRAADRGDLESLRAFART